MESYGSARPSPADSIGAGSSSSRGGHCCSEASGSDTRMASWCCCWPDDEAPGDDEETSRPSPRRNEELDEVAPICAAFCSSAVADMCADGDGDGGGGGGANCWRSAVTGAAEKIDDDASVARHSGGGLAGWARSGRPPRSAYCGADAIDDGANIPPSRLCDVPATLLLLLLALTLAAALTEACESTGSCNCGGGANWTASVAFVYSD